MALIMNDETEILNEADEMSALLPWYVTGEISAGDRARIERYAERNPAFAAEIALAREEADAVFAANQAIAPPDGALDRLRQSVAATPSARLAAVQSSLIDRAGAWLAAFTPRQLAYAGMAAALAITVQAASIGTLLTSGAPGSGYQTASGPAGVVADGTFALIVFAPEAPASAIQSVLTESGIAIVDGPRAGGFYRVRLGDADMSDEAVSAALAGLTARAEIVMLATRDGTVP
jgi:anti-sigma factor RsiW